MPEPVILNNSVIKDMDVVGDQQPNSKRPRSDSNTMTGAKVMCLPSGSVACNGPLCEMIKIVKPIIRKLVEDCKCFQSFAQNEISICNFILFIFLFINLFIHSLSFVVVF